MIDGKRSISGLDYRALGLICGIEIHQQLDTACKLFCGCPTKHREVEESNFEFFRYLRPSRSELGEIDRAALEEVLVSRKFLYKSYDTTCLVEADEEPPREINAEALEISLVIARLLNMKIVDELQTMRKMVIDGSNTSGFQRTAYIGSNGMIETAQGAVGIGVLCLEEEAARIIEDQRRQPGLLSGPAGHSSGGDRHGSGYRLSGARPRGGILPGHDPALHRPGEEGTWHHPPGCECLHQRRRSGGGKGRSGPEPGR